MKKFSKGIIIAVMALIFVALLIYFYAHGFFQDSSLFLGDVFFGIMVPAFVILSFFFFRQKMQNLSFQKRRKVSLIVLGIGVPCYIALSIKKYVAEPHSLQSLSGILYLILVAIFIFSFFQHLFSKDKEPKSEEDNIKE